MTKTKTILIATVVHPRRGWHKKNYAAKRKLPTVGISYPPWPWLGQATNQRLTIHPAIRIKLKENTLRSKYMACQSQGYGTNFIMIAAMSSLPVFCRT
jgi:hypothetical protein